MSDCKDNPPDAGNHSSDRPGEDAATAERLQWEQERELTLEFFRLVHSSESIATLVDAAVDFFRRQSRCQAVAVRLREGGDYPYFHALGFSEEFLVCENRLCARDCFGEVISDISGEATLECRCGEVLRGGLDPALPYFTANGSFWTNSASQQRGAFRPPHHRARCRTEGYESIALIALRAGKDRIGLLQMNDRRQGMFTLEKILLWESFAGFLAVALARLNAEETLRKSEQRLAQAVSIARLGIFEHEHGTGTSHCSQSFRAMYRLDENLPVTRELVLSRIVAEDRASLEEALRRSFDPAGDGLLQHEHCVEHPEGVRWLYARAQTIFAGEAGGRKPLRTVGAILDITRQKQAELEIAASRRQLRTALEAANFGIWSRDLETGILSGDTVTHSILGWDKDQVLTKESVLDYIVPEDRERFLQDRVWLEQCDHTVSSEFRIGTPQNELRWIAIWGHQVRDRHGKPVMVTGLMQDITSRKRNEAQLKALEEQVRHSQKMEAIGHLAGAMSHDFNNLLMVIRSYAEILQDGFSPSEVAHRHTQAIMKAADRAAALTSQLLAFSRKQVLSPVPVNLNDSIAESAKMLARLVGEAIELRVEAGPLLWTVLADPDQMAQVLVNLGVNSRDAMPAGGALTLQTRNVTADAGFIQRHPYFLAGDYVMLSVNDTGTGIPPEVQERMFEPFFTTKGVGKGTGLGLSTVYGIVKQSGGYLVCDSRPGEGATFRMYLPRLSSQHSAAGAAGGGWMVRGRETILLVEDEDALRESIGHFLVDLGYNVLAAASGAEAQQLAGQHEQPIHALITDVHMPKMSGRELSQALAALRPQMKTIYMSGYIEDDEVRHGVLEEGTTFLQKPFSLGVLARKLRKLLG